MLVFVKTETAAKISSSEKEFIIRKPYGEIILEFMKCLLLHSLKKFKSSFGDGEMKLWMARQVYLPTGKDL